MKILEKTSSRSLVEYILSSKQDFATEKSVLNKIDFVVTSKSDQSKKYGVAVRYRNIPYSETRSQVFENTDIQQIKEICSKEGLVPVIAFALYDEEINKTYAFICTIQQMEELSKDEKTKNALSEVVHGLQIKYGVGHATSQELLYTLKNNVDCTEIQRGKINFYD